MFNKAKFHKELQDKTSLNFVDDFTDDFGEGRFIHEKNNVWARVWLFGKELGDFGPFIIIPERIEFAVVKERQTVYSDELDDEDISDVTITQKLKELVEAINS